LTDNTAVHDEIKKLIVDTLELEDITPAEIETDAPLFGEGLDLDSIDSLEIAMVLEEHYGVTLGDDPDTNAEIFSSVRSLGVFVTQNRAE
jgi:acyl carrier protein